MSEPPTSVLVISDNAGHSERVRRMLGCAGHCPGHACTFRVESANGLTDALERLHGGGVDVILLDDAPPNQPGPVELEQVLKAAPLAMVLLRQREAGKDRSVHYALQGGAHDEFING